MIDPLQLTFTFFVGFFVFYFGFSRLVLGKECRLPEAIAWSIVIASLLPVFKIAVSFLGITK